MKKSPEIIHGNSKNHYLYILYVPKYNVELRNIKLPNGRNIEIPIISDVSPYGVRIGRSNHKYSRPEQHIKLYRKDTKNTPRNVLLRDTYLPELNDMMLHLIKIGMMRVKTYTKFTYKEIGEAEAFLEKYYEKCGIKVYKGADAQETGRKGQKHKNIVYDKYWYSWDRARNKGLLPHYWKNDYLSYKTYLIDNLPKPTEQECFTRINRKLGFIKNNIMLTINGGYPINMYSADSGKLLKQFKSKTEAEKELKVRCISTYMVNGGSTYTYNGYAWAYSTANKKDLQKYLRDVIKAKKRNPYALQGNYEKSIKIYYFKYQTKEYLGEFKSVNDAQVTLKITGVKEVIDFKQKQLKGYIFTRAKGKTPDEALKIWKKNRPDGHFEKEIPLYQFDVYTQKFIKFWNNAMEVEKTLGYGRGNILGVVHFKSRYYKDCIWLSATDCTKKQALLLYNKHHSTRPSKNLINAKLYKVLPWKMKGL